METPATAYLDNSLKLFSYYKSLGDKLFPKLTEEQLHWRYNEESNSIATVIKHISGNSLSRWTDFLTSDGEKERRNRDGEFEATELPKTELIKLWERGWQCLFSAISPLTEDDLLRTVYIRNESHTVMEAINRQLAHLPYHVGQIVYVAKMVLGDSYISLTIPKGKSAAFNSGKFLAQREERPFTGEPEKK